MCLLTNFDEVITMKIIKKYWIYVLLILVLAIIRVLPYSIGNASVDEAINEIAIGGIASVVVALFIQVSDDRKFERKNRMIAARMMYSLIKEVFVYMDRFPIVLCFPIPKARNMTRLFLEWNEAYCDKVLSDNKFVGISKEDYFEMKKNIVMRADEILNSEYWYLAEGILSVEDIEFVKKLRNHFSSFDILFVYGINIENVRTFNKQLIKIFDERKDFEQIKDWAQGYDHRFVDNLNPKIFMREI